MCFVVFFVFHCKSCTDTELCCVVNQREQTRTTSFSSLFFVVKQAAENTVPWYYDCFITVFMTVCHLLYGTVLVLYAQIIIIRYDVGTSLLY